MAQSFNMGVIFIVVSLVLGIILVTSQTATIADNLNESETAITAYDAGAGSLFSINYLLLALLPLALMVTGVVKLFKSG